MKETARLRSQARACLRRWYMDPILLREGCFASRSEYIRFHRHLYQRIKSGKIQPRTPDS